MVRNADRHRAVFFLTQPLVFFCKFEITWQFTHLFSPKALNGLKLNLSFSIAHETATSPLAHPKAVHAHQLSRCRNPLLGASPSLLSAAVSVRNHHWFISPSARPSTTTRMWSRNTPLPSNKRPANFLSLRILAHGFQRLAAHELSVLGFPRQLSKPMPASRGETDSSISEPYRFMPASRRSVSRAPRANRLYFQHDCNFPRILLLPQTAA